MILRSTANASPQAEGDARNALTRAGQNAAEEQWISRARSGDAEAFDRLFALHKDETFACLYNLLNGDTEAVEEALGNVFLNAFRALPRFRGEAAFSTYLYRIAINEAHAQRRKRGRRERSEAPLTQAEEALRDPHQVDPSAQVEQEEEQRRLTRAVRALPEPYRTPVMLRYLSDIAAVEIAKILKRPAGTVRYQVSRGLDILRERLEREEGR